MALKDGRVEQCLRSCGSEFQMWGPKQEKVESGLGSLSLCHLPESGLGFHPNPSLSTPLLESGLGFHPNLSLSTPLLESGLGFHPNLSLSTLLLESGLVFTQTDLSLHPS